VSEIKQKAMTWAYFFKMARKRRRAKRSEEKEKGQTQAKNEIGGFEQCFWLFFFIFFFATIYLVGHTREMNVPIALYFLTVTMTGVGYGEFYPGSQESRVVIMFFALLGNMVIFMIMSEVSDTVLDVRLEVLRRIKRAVVFAGVGHSSRVAQMQAVLIEHPATEQATAHAADVDDDALHAGGFNSHQRNQNVSLKDVDPAVAKLARRHSRAVAKATEKAAREKTERLIVKQQSGLSNNNSARRVAHGPHGSHGSHGSHGGHGRLVAAGPGKEESKTTPRSSEEEEEEEEEASEGGGILDGILDVFGWGDEDEEEWSPDQAIADAREPPMVTLLWVYSGLVAYIFITGMAFNVKKGFPSPSSTFLFFFLFFFFFSFHRSFYLTPPLFSLPLSQ
jgi:hypothetical protein